MRRLSPTGGPRGTERARAGRVVTADEQPSGRRGEQAGPGEAVRRESWGPFLLSPGRAFREGRLITKDYFTDGDTEAQRWEARKATQQGQGGAHTASRDSGAWGSRLSWSGVAAGGSPGPLVFTPTPPRLNPSGYLLREKTILRSRSVSHDGGVRCRSKGPGAGHRKDIDLVPLGQEELALAALGRGLAGRHPLVCLPGP